MPGRSGVTPLTVACVRAGDKYPVDYVHRLRRMVARHLDRPHRFVVLTDDSNALPGYDTVGVSRELPGWWAKMALFSAGWREGRRVLYLDLDMVICGDLGPLADLDVDFGICANFTRAAGIETWPCRYGSCVMTFAPGWGGDVWQRFMADRDAIMLRNARGGDQRAIEELVPDAALLQERLPAGFLCGYRDLLKHQDRKPDSCSVVVFAGKHKPDNCNIGWVRDEWG